MIKVAVHTVDRESLIHQSAMVTTLKIAGTVDLNAPDAVSQAMHHTLQHDLVCMQALARYVLPEGRRCHHAAEHQN